jgi:hypothetical protein
MNSYEKAIITVVTFLVICALFVGGICIYSNGYKSGQSDALMGKYKYSLQTNVVIELKK